MLAPTLAKHALLALLTCFVLFLGSCGGSSGSSTPQPTPSTTDITVTFANNVLPTAIAQQIGTGSWNAAAAPTGNPLTVTLPSGTTNYGFAYVCPSNSQTPFNNEYVIEATVIDGTSYTVTCSADLPTGALTGTVTASAFPTVSYVEIAGVFSELFVSGNSGAISGNLTAATKDIAVVAEDTSGTVLGLQILRNQTVPGALNGGSTVSLTSADAPSSTQSISLTNVPSGYSYTNGSTMYNTANGTYFQLNTFNNSFQYPVVPATASQSGDYYGFFGGAYTTPGASNTNQIVSVYQTSPTPGAITLSLPAPLSLTAPTPAALPTFDFTYSGFMGMTALSDYVRMQWIPSSTAYNLTLAATSNFLNGSTSLTVPDLSSITGFYPKPTSGSPVFWTASVYGGTYHWFMASPATGSLSEATNQGTYTVP